MPPDLPIVLSHRSGDLSANRFAHLRLIAEVFFAFGVRTIERKEFDVDQLDGIFQTLKSIEPQAG